MEMIYCMTLSQTVGHSRTKNDTCKHKVGTSEANKNDKHCMLLKHISNIAIQFHADLYIKFVQSNKH